MSTHATDRRSVAQRVENRRAAARLRGDEASLIASALWLHIGFAGATIAAAGVVMLVTGDANAFAAIAGIVGGVGVAAISWRSGRETLEQREHGAAETDSPRTAAHRSRNGYPT